MSVVLFLYGFFLIAAFNYGRNLTGKKYLIVLGLMTGLPLMLLAPGLYMNLPFATGITALILGLILMYQSFYWWKYQFFPAKTGFILHLIVIMCFVASRIL